MFECALSVESGKKQEADKCCMSSKKSRKRAILRTSVRVNPIMG